MILPKPSTISRRGEEKVGATPAHPRPHCLGLGQCQHMTDTQYVSAEKLNIPILAMRTFHLLSLNDLPEVTEQRRKLEFSALTFHFYSET